MCAGNKNKVNCQCDGNCDCGKVLPNGEISCDNCGWKAPQAYSSLTGNYTCPSCRTESSYSSNNNNLKTNEMNNSNNNLSQGMVGLATVNPGFLNWSQNPLGKSNGKNNTESSFANNISSQNMVGYAIGQDWTVLNPFGRGGESGFAENLSDDDKKWAELFYQSASEFDVPDTEESGLFGDKLKNFVTRFTPTGILIRQSWSSKYCKALGYMRSADKNGFKKCMAATKINFQNAKSGKWKYPAAPEIPADTEIDLDMLAAESAKETAGMTAEQKAAYLNQAAGEDAQIAGLISAKTAGSTPTKNNTIMYVIIGVVILAIIIAIIIIMRNKAAKAKA